MNNRPITPKIHGIIDYAFTASLVALPALLGFDRKAVQIYAGLGSMLAGYNAITDHGAGVSPVVSLDSHKKIDLGNLAMIYSLTALKPIRKRKVLAFHLAMAALATANVALTDWGSRDTDSI